jgi:hypothetical protein
MPGLTPTARKFGYAATKKPPAVINLSDFQQMSGVRGAINAWKQEVERVCRELVNDQVGKSARVDGEQIFIE